jgi:glycosyltransferase involved in cell wall biosynthesis
VNVERRGTGVAMDPGGSWVQMDVSVVLPAYNEVDTIDGIYEQVTSVLTDEVCSFEIIFVDDGSTDGTWDKIAAIVEKDPHVRALRHRRNFGKASELANGFTYARGDIVVTSDSDMQYDPADILRLIDKVREGYDVVSAYKVVRRDPLSKRIPSWFFNYFVRSTTHVPLHDINAGLKAFRCEAALDLISFGYGELHRFFVIIAARRGYSVAEVEVESLYRTAGRSKYGMERYMRGALDYMTVLFLSGYAERPLHLLGAMGVWLSGIGTVLFFAVVIYTLVVGDRWSGNLLLEFSQLLVVTGVQMVVSGLIAELINNRERPTAGRAKIAQVLRIERRSSRRVAPGVFVERRRASRGTATDWSEAPAD